MITRLVAGLINFFMGLVEAFLVLRFVLRFFAANPTNSFVHWVYTSSSTLLQPFRSIFPTEVVGKNHVVDFTALFAMIVYAVFTALVVYLLYLLSPDRYTVVGKRR
jgi:YggT family protein